MKLKIHLSETDQRLDKWIKRKFTNIPQSLLEKYSRKGKIKVNEKKTRLSYKVKEGDVIKIPNFDFEKKKNYSPKNKDEIRLINEIVKSIIHKDKEKIIINKPSGVAVHKGTKTFLSINDIKDGLKFSCSEAPRTIHRIDKETSGILILSRTYKSSVYLSEQFRKRNLEKFYLAVLNGVPKKTGTIKNEIKDTKNKEAISNFIILSKYKKEISLVLVKPITGRKRQIREHFFELGYPVLGDRKYFKNFKKNTQIDANKLYLHSYKLNIINEKGKIEKFTADIPNHIKKICYLYKMSINKNLINEFTNTKYIKRCKKIKN